MSALCGVSYLKWRSNMRVKINQSTNVPKLEYGKSYELKLASCGWYYRFKYTRKKNLSYKEMNRGCHVTGDIQITKKSLKQLINSAEFTESVIEADFSSDILHSLLGDVDYAFDMEKFINNKRYNVYLSRYYNVPSEIDTVEMELKTILKDLCNIDLIINKITAVSVNGEFKECIGISLLNNYKEIKGESIRSLYILLS